MGRRALVLVAAVGTVVAVALNALPAGAAQTGATTASFTLTSGTLGIAVPATAALGSFPVTSPNVTGNLGTVTVADNRGLGPASWTVAVSSTNFVGSGAAVGNDLDVTNIAYDPGTITETNIVTTGIVVDPMATTPQNTVTAAGGFGVNAVSWNPELTITIPSDQQVTGNYTATVTHSVA
jgi:hypothetical protein